jgi:hypothetical protein
MPLNDWRFLLGLIRYQPSSYRGRKRLRIRTYMTDCLRGPDDLKGTAWLGLGDLCLSKSDRPREGTSLALGQLLRHS